MKPPGAWKYAFYLIWFSVWIIAGLILFARGFFLSRRALPDVSECLSFEKFGCDGLPSNYTTSCTKDEKIKAILSRPDALHVCAPHKAKLILVVVDAFRYDFAEYNDSLKHPLAYQNKLPVIKKLLKSTKNTRLLKFIADPPTTTLQRLKGLMTGSLPTFIDAGANFATAEIAEDNLIDQFRRGGGKAVLLGDDTWLRLFPGRWMRTHAQYSFHTWDLDTVDNEVDSRIYAELARSDWQLLVAHYLGVDHAGHRYGPHHTEMTRKLTELNERLERLTDEMPQDAILCVIGDHGMTETGDHGGDSAQEVTATLLLHSPSGLAFEAEIGTSVRQTDLAATLAVSVGRISPSPSLGLLQLAGLPHKYQESWRETLLLVVSNLDQVMRYTQRYATESEELDTVRLHEVSLPYAELRARAAGVSSAEEFLAYYEDVRTFLESVRRLCQTAWVEFDSLGMMRGCLILIMAVFLNYLVIEGIPVSRLTPVFRSAFVPCAYIGILTTSVIAAGLKFLSITDDFEHAALFGGGLCCTLMLTVLVVQHWDGVAERWYQAKDAFTHERLARAALVASAAALLSNSFIIEEGSVSAFLFMSVLLVCSPPTRSAVMLWFAAGASVALTRAYRACREEQGACWTAVGTGAGAEGARGAVLLSMLSLGSTVAAFKHWSKEGQLFWRHVPTVAAVCVCGHWSAGWGGGPAARRSRLLARASWGLLALMLATLLARPGRAAETLGRLALVVYLACSLALGSTAATPAALLFFAGAVTLRLLAEARKYFAQEMDGARSDTCAAVLWCLLSTHWLYATGHHATLAHVRWSAAFHAGHLATQQTLPRLVAAAFIWINTFGGYFLFGVTSPLLMLWSPRGETSDDSKRPLSEVFLVCLKLQFCYALRLLGCMFAATIHCRHLMVWGVFAPKLMYEAAGVVTALAGINVGFLLFVRCYQSQRTHTS